MERKLLKPIYECRCNGRLQTKRFTRLTNTGSVVELEVLQIKMRLTNVKIQVHFDFNELGACRAAEVELVMTEPETAKKRSCKNKSLTNSLCNLPLVLAIAGINDAGIIYAICHDGT
jgi:hypothetical protein